MTDPLQPPPPSPAKPKGGMKALGIGGAILVGIVILAFKFGMGTLVGNVLFPDVTKADVGACLTQGSQDNKVTYKEVDCDDADASLVVLAKVSSVKDCVDVVGAEFTYTLDSNVICIGTKGADLSKAINGIKPGECVTEDQQAVSKTPCNGPAAYPVLLVLKDVSKADLETDEEYGWQQCVAGGAADTDLVYWWGMVDEGSTATTWDRLLCLGPPAA